MGQPSQAVPQHMDQYKDTKTHWVLIDVLLLSDILVAWLMLVVMLSDVGGAGAVDITKRMRRPVVGQNRSRSGS